MNAKFPSLRKMFTNQIFPNLCKCILHIWATKKMSNCTYIQHKVTNSNSNSMLILKYKDTEDSNKQKQTRIIKESCLFDDTKKAAIALPNFKLYNTNSLINDVWVSTRAGLLAKYSTESKQAAQAYFNRYDYLHFP